MWIQTKISSRHSWPQICDVHQTTNDLKEQFTLNLLLLSADGSPLSVSGASQWDNVTWCSESRRQFLLSAPVQMFSSDFYAHEKTRCCQDGFWLDVKEPRLSIIRRRTEWTAPLSVKASILKMILEQKFNTAHVQETLQVSTDEDDDDEDEASYEGQITKDECWNMNVRRDLTACWRQNYDIHSLVWSRS